MIFYYFPPSPKLYAHAMGGNGMPHIKTFFCVRFLFFFKYFHSAPPVIEPFSFPKNLQDGGRAQVTCAVSSGDMPIVFAWKKDGHQISPSLQVIKI